MSPFLALALLLGITSANAYSFNDIGSRWRHQFQYFLNDPSESNVMAVKMVWENAVEAFMESHPGTVENYVFGMDLGISKDLYPSVTSPNADFAGRVDFKTESALHAFWSMLYPMKEYQDMLTEYVKSASRIQYIAKTSLYVPGTYYRSTWEYNLANTSSNAVQAVVANWFKWAQASPAKVKAFAAGADIGFSSEYYPTPNWAVGGSITFYTKAELVKFWAYLYPRSDYQDLLKTTTGATRIQYAAKY